MQDTGPPGPSLDTPDLDDVLPRVDYWQTFTVNSIDHAVAPGLYPERIR